MGSREGGGQLEKKREFYLVTKKVSLKHGDFLPAVVHRELMFLPYEIEFYLSHSAPLFSMFDLEIAGCFL